MAKDLNVNYEVDEEDVMDDVGQDIELLDQDYIEDEEPEVEEEVTAESAKLAQREAELRDRLASGQDSQDATAAAMKEIAETMKDLRGQPKSQEQQSQLQDLVELKKKLSSNFYDNPMEAIDSYFDAKWKDYEQKTLQPAFNQIAKVTRDTALDGSRRVTEQSDTGKIVLADYYDEVKQLIDSGQIPVGPNAYDEAVSRVAGRHMTDIFAKMQSESAAKAQADAELPPARGSSPGRGGSASPKPSSSVQLSRRAVEEIEKLNTKRLDPEAFRQWFVRHNPDKVREFNRRAR